MSYSFVKIRDVIRAKIRLHSVVEVAVVVVQQLFVAADVLEDVKDLTLLTFGCNGSRICFSGLQWVNNSEFLSKIFFRLKFLCS